MFHKFSALVHIHRPTTYRMRKTAIRTLIISVHDISQISTLWKSQVSQFPGPRFPFDFFVSSSNILDNTWSPSDHSVLTYDTLMKLLFSIWGHLSPVLCFLLVNIISKIASWVKRREISDISGNVSIASPPRLSIWSFIVQLWFQQKSVIYAIRFGKESGKFLCFPNPWIFFPLGFMLKA